MLSIVLGLVAAFLFAVGTVFQQKAAMQESEDAAQSAGFLLTLARKPVWLFGVAMSGLGFAAQAAALGVGRLVVVQPLLVASIVFALPLGAKFTGQRVGRREIVGAIAVTAGIAGFLIIGNPSEGATTRRSSSGSSPAGSSARSLSCSCSRAAAGDPG